MIENGNIDGKLNEIASIVIKEKRLKHGYSLEDVVNKMNNIITRQSLYRYENNDARMKVDIFNKICSSLNEDPEVVWNEINKRFSNSINIDNARLIQQAKPFIQIPILGRIPAGTPIEAIEEIIGWEDIPAHWVKNNEKYFALLIDGDSMLPEYRTGDIIIVRQISDYDSGNDCVVLVNGYDATFKRIIKEEDGIKLKPLNNDYETKKYNSEEIINKPVIILGVAREVRRKLDGQF